jgi:hypothetical protein
MSKVLSKSELLETNLEKRFESIMSNAFEMAMCFASGNLSTKSNVTVSTGVEKTKSSELSVSIRSI